MKRLFFAFWPDEAMRRQVAELGKKLSGQGLRPVAAKNLHATLVFLGGVDAEQEAAITAAAGELAVPSSMSVTFDKLSYWKKPAIYCLTGRHFDRSVADLTEQLAAIATRFGVKVDERPFKPHITLARKARTRIDVEFEPIVWQADAFCLVESCSMADGVEYRVIRRWSSQQPSNHLASGEKPCLI